MTPDNWRRYYTSEPALLPNRRQSAAFLQAYGLVPLPLQAHSKVALVGPPPPFPDWRDIDHPDPRNWSTAIPRATPTAIWADIDFDTRTLSSGTPWTEALLAEAKHYQHILSDALDTFGVSCHRFGRDSLDSLGHALMPIALDGTGLRQPPLDLIDLLHMKRKVKVGNLLIGIELRRASEKRLAIPKSITLPGSTYPGLAQPLDLIRWREEADFRDGATWERKLSPQPLHALRMALYAALLTLGVLPYWAQGDRHAMALLVAGTLAHEAGAGFLGNDAANPEDPGRVFQFILRQTGDPEAKDRLKVFMDTMNAFHAGRPVTGYKTLRETVGEDIVKALLAMRGGSDPDAINTMFANAVYVETENRYIWLPEGAGDRFMRTHQEMQQFLRHHPEFPPIPRQGKAGDIQVVDIVLNHPRKQRVVRTVAFPGVDFGIRYDQDYVAIDNDDQLSRIERGEQTRHAYAINISSGFATTPLLEGESPDQHAWDRARFLWRRHRAWLTQDDPLQNAKLDQLIARKIQKPRIKFQLGCALVGGQGTGKSALFSVILDAVVGAGLIGHSNRSDMNTDFRYNDLDTSLFYILEELRLANAKPELQESIKDLMRNPVIKRNRKYQTQDICRNVAIPFIVSNEKNPSLLVDGVPDRALVVIHGHSQATLGCTVEEWTAIKTRINEEVAEFKEALEEQSIRQALFHYWDTLEIDLAIFNDTESINVSAEDVIRTLSPRGQALIDMLASGNIFPGRDGASGPSIYEPFLYEAIADGLMSRTGKPVTVREVGSEFAELFMDDRRKHDRKPNDTVSREQRDKMVRARRWTPPTEKLRRFYYLAMYPHDLATWLKAHRNIDLDFEFEIYPAATGEVPEPDNESLARSWKKWLSYVPMRGMPRGLGAP